MAKVAQEVARWKLPKDLPAGVIIDTSKRTVGTKPKREAKESMDDYKARVKASGEYAAGQLVTVLRVAETGEGVRNAIELLSKHGPGEDYGIKFAAAALNSALQGHVAKLTPATVGDSLSLVPPCSGPRYVDRVEAATSKVADAYRAAIASGKKMSEAEITKLFMAEMGS
jgi:hypothetical protein